MNTRSRLSCRGCFGFGISILDATGKRLLRGLFFLETGMPMPPEGKIRIASQPGADAGHPLVIKFAEVHGTLIDRRHRSIGTAFSYVAGFGNGFSVWLLLLYDHFAWVGTVPITAPNNRLTSFGNPYNTRKPQSADVCQQVSTPQN